MVYKGDKTAEYISISEGLAMKTASGFAYQYNLSDHLGNVRVVLNQDKSVAQSTNYYPFGLAHATSALDKNKYLYNGKEIQSDIIGGTAFGMLDYGARFYDPVIGRWHSIDPLASKYAGLSGYNYGLNNPMKFIDPDGKSVWLTEGANGTYSVLGGDLNDKDRNMYVYKDGVRGQSIGITTSTTSFYDSDKEVWAVGSVINPNDKSGDNFLNSIFENNPPMFDDYMAKAGNGGIYDFKATTHH